jgi:hypothetical protein
MEQKPEQPQSPLDRARSLIDTQKKEQASQEELVKKEEDIRLDGLFDRYSELTEALKKVEGEKSSHESTAYKLDVEKNNIASGERQAAEVLKADSATKPLFDKDTEGNAELHEKRREVFQGVFGEAQDEKRAVKRTRKQALGDISKTSQEYGTIHAEIEAIKESPDWRKLIEKKKNEVLELDREYSEFYRNQKKSENQALYSALKKVNEFSAEYQSQVETLKEMLNTELDTLLANEHAVFENAKKSPEYQPKVFGEIDFEKYTKLLPKSVDELEFSIYSSDQSRLTFPQLDYKSPLYQTLSTDISNIDDQIQATKKAINECSGLFSGKGKLEKQLDQLKAKSQFLSKIRESTGYHESNFHKKEFPETIHFSPHHRGDDEYRRNIGYTVGRYVAGISSNVHPLDSKEKTFPEFQRITNKNDLFQWAKENDIPVEYKDAFIEKEKLSNQVGQKRQEYNLVAGDEASSRLHL